MGKLDGKVAVITGGSSGIGLATAHLFRKEGAHVVIAARTEASLHAAQKELGDDVMTVQADISSPADLEQLFDTVASRWGGVDVLFANAATGQMGPIAEMTEAMVDEMIDTNVKGTFYTIQKALPVLRDHASVIISGSIMGHVGMRGMSVYAASKAAIHSFAKTMSAELTDRGIRVNALIIGPTDTPIYQKVDIPQEQFNEMAQAITGRMAIHRFGKPEEIANTALFLASEDSSFLVGTAITADGGLAMNRF